MCTDWDCPRMTKIVANSDFYSYSIDISMYLLALGLGILISDTIRPDFLKLDISLVRGALNNAEQSRACARIGLST